MSSRTPSSAPDPAVPASRERQAKDDDSLLDSIGEAISAPVLGADEKAPGRKDPVPPGEKAKPIPFDDDEDDDWGSAPPRQPR